MKYIKQYEDVQYRVGDFVLTDKTSWSTVQKDKLPNYLIAEIFDKMFDTYFVEYCNNFMTRLEDYEIIRKATPEEIEEYNLRKDSNKYNL